MSHFPVCFMLFGVLLYVACAQELSTCVITNTSCPCTVRWGSGACMRYQGDGKCLIGKCSEGHKCDCLAYENCKISKCSKYTTLENAIPSAETPFLCRLTPDAGTCTNFVSFVDTLEGVDFAKQEASQSVTTINMDMRAAIDAIIAVQEDKVAVDAALDQLDAITTITDAERTQVENEASVVMGAMLTLMNEVSSLQSLTSEANEANNNVAHNRLLAHSKERLAVQKETEAKNEAEKPENKDNCPRCIELNLEGKQLRSERSEAIKEAGRSAQRARAAMYNAKVHGENIIRIKQDSVAARARAEDLANKITERARMAGSTNVTGGGSGGGSGGEPNTGNEPSTGNQGNMGQGNTGNQGQGKGVSGTNG